jgi:hypothetical protein
MNWYSAKGYPLLLAGLSAAFGLLAFLDSAHPSVGLFVAYVGGGILAGAIVGGIVTVLLNPGSSSQRD